MMEPLDVARRLDAVLTEAERRLREDQHPARVANYIARERRLLAQSVTEGARR